jgi:hypothetical protein
VLIIDPQSLSLVILLFCWWSKRIVLIDTGLFDFADYENKIQQIVRRLSRLGLVRKLEIIKPHNHSDLVGQANVLSVELALAAVSKMRANRGDSFFLGGYLAQRMQPSYALDMFLRMLSERLDDRCLIKNDYLEFRGFNRSLTVLFLNIGLTVLLPFLLIFESTKRVSLALRAIAIRRGGICVDLCHGPGLDVSGRPQNNGIYSDSFLVKNSGLFSLSNHLFLAHGWNKDRISMWKKEISKHGGVVFGLLSGRTRMSVLCLLNLIYQNLSIWISASINKGIPEPTGGWTLRLRWINFKYQLDFFRAQLSFAHLKPRIYVSRLDYDYRHHALGAECYRQGTHFSGIGHSPLGGVTHTPSFSIISFSTYFAYHEIFWKKFFPALQISSADLHQVGVWRTDFIRQSEKINENTDLISMLKKKLGSRFTVGIHLPVPRSYLFDETATERWIAIFDRIVKNNTDIAFVLFPRRIHESPRAFVNKVYSLVIKGRCELAGELSSQWSQAYSFYPLLDFVVGCTYSDTVLEALACEIPALSYADVGKGLSELEEFDSSLSVYDGKSIEDAIIRAKLGRWPSVDLWTKIENELIMTADGRCIDRIRNVLSKYLD